jgi:hypothetical protein
MLSPDFIFNWHSLHFIGISYVLTTILMCIDARAAIPFVILMMLLRYPIERYFSQFLFAPSDMSGGLLQATSWLWIFCVALLAASIFLIIKLSRRWWLLLVPMIVALIAYRSTLVSNPKNLASFLNIPIGMWIPTGDQDLNYWPLVVFYPLFLAGYFIRVFLFKFEWKKYFAPLLALTCLYLVFFFFDQWHDFVMKANPQRMVSKEFYRIGYNYIAAIIAFYFVTLSAFYYLVRRTRIRIFERWAELSRSIIAIYLIHGLLFSIFRWNFPFDKFGVFADPGTGFYALYIIVHVVYLLTLIISDWALRALELQKLKLER